MSVMNAAPKIFDAVISQRQVEDLKPDPRNARTHSSKQIQKLAASIKEFGFIVPVLVDGQGTILAGHARVEAAKQLGMDRVPYANCRYLLRIWML